MGYRNWVPKAEMVATLVKQARTDAEGGYTNLGCCIREDCEPIEDYIAGLSKELWKLPTQVLVETYNAMTGFDY